MDCQIFLFNSKFESKAKKKEKKNVCSEIMGRGEAFSKTSRAVNIMILKEDGKRCNTIMRRRRLKIIS